MNNGSIIASSSVSSAAEYRGGCVSSFEEKLSGSERFDSLIDLFGRNKEEQPKADLTDTKPSDQSMPQEVNKEEKRSDDESDTIPDDPSTQELQESAQTQQHAVVSEESKVEKEKLVDPKEASSKSGETKESKQEEQAPKLSSSITLRQHQSKTATDKVVAEKKTLATTESVKEDKTSSVKTTTTEKKVAVAQETSVQGKSDKAQSELQDNKKVSAGKPDTTKTSGIKTQADSGQGKVVTQTTEGKTSVETTTTDQGKKLLNTSSATAATSAKTTYSTKAQGDPQPTEDVKNQVKPFVATDESTLKTLEREIGIKGAVHSADKQMAILAKDKAIEEKGSDKAFLRDSSESASGSRAQSVTSRSEMNGSASHQQSGSQDQSLGAREQFRQWITEAGEIRNTAQSAQQSQFVDRSTVSHLSVHVLNQIMNHIERLRESDKNRVRVSLGMGESGGISVDIRLEDGSISTSFQGDEDMLNELKRDWRDISEKANRKGVVLNDPEFISYSSSVESSNSLPDSDIEQEEKSQSVIQHKDNQPMRPGIETAAAGSSSPVHSYA